MLQPNRRIHKCSHCEKEGAWDVNWTWFGSVRQEENHPEDIIKACSEECREALSQEEGYGL